eukprot:1925368-Amphidinium_carterae.1
MGHITFEDDTQIRNTYLKYLGALLDDTGHAIRELNSCITDIIRIYTDSTAFFNSFGASAQPVCVTNAVLKAQLAYGLESTASNAFQEKRLDSLQMRFLRRIDQVPCAYIARDWPRSRVWNTINAHLTRRMNANPLTTCTRDLHVPREKLLGHICRAAEQDPLSITTEAIPTFFTRRVGRPRICWIDMAFLLMTSSP